MEHSLAQLTSQVTLSISEPSWLIKWPRPCCKPLDSTAQLSPQLCLADSLHWTSVQQFPDPAWRTACHQFGCSRLDLSLWSMNVLSLLPRAHAEVDGQIRASARRLELLHFFADQAMDNIGILESRFHIDTIWKQNGYEIVSSAASFRDQEGVDIWLRHGLTKSPPVVHNDSIAKHYQVLSFCFLMHDPDEHSAYNVQQWCDDTSALLARHVSIYFPRAFTCSLPTLAPWFFRCLVAQRDPSWTRTGG